jgi:hypothetical protein
VEEMSLEVRKLSLTCIITEARLETQKNAGEFVDLNLRIKRRRSQGFSEESLVRFESFFRVFREVLTGIKPQESKDFRKTS